MSARQLLGGAAIVGVLATVFWYVVVAPSRGAAVAPESTPRLALTAAATGTGSWIRYLVTVKNLADGDFDGDLMLVDQVQDREQTAASLLPDIGGAPRIPTAPVVAGQSAYQVHLLVRSRTTEQVAMLAPAFFTAVQAVMGGQLLAFQSVIQGPMIPVAVLSDQETAADAIQALRFDRFNPRVMQISLARRFPSSAIQLAGYTAVVIDQFDSSTLSQAQVQSLRQFVGFGGTLILSGGSGWRRSIAPLPADLLPLRPTSTANLSLAPVAALAGNAVESRTAPSAVGGLAPTARSVLDGAGGAALVAELPYGTGKIVELAYDPSGDGNAGTPLASLGWGQGLARAINQIPGNTPLTASILGPDPAFTLFLPGSGDAQLPPPWLTALFVLIYLVVVGPGAYLLVTRRWRRPALYWAIVPVSAAMFTGAFYLTGSALQGSLQDREIQLVRVGPSDTVNVLEYHRILFLRRGDHLIDPASNALLSPLTLETFRTTGSTCERCISQLAGLPSGSESVLLGPHPLVQEKGVIYGSVRVVAASRVTSAPVRLAPELNLHSGMVQGTVANIGRQAVFRLELFSFDGQVLHRADLAPYVPAGIQEPVAGPLVAADSPPPMPAAEAILLRAVAAQALTAPGQAVVVGLMALLPSKLTVDGATPPRTGLAVLQQPVTLGRSDSSFRDVQRKWLASAVGDQKNGFIDAYDITVPSSDTRLAVTYNATWASNVEVYDWTQGAFVAAASVPAAEPAASQVPLRPELVRDGLVRVRIHEPRLSWGTNVWVDAAA
jgi:hypothetical protein